MLSVAVALAGVSLPGHAQVPQRIVSINLCADELVLRIAEPKQIASVTWLSHDPANTNLAGLASRYPANRGLTEEVIALKPDLVIAGRHTTRNTVDQLNRAGVAVLELDMPASLAETEAQIRMLGARLGQMARARAIIAAMRARLADIPLPTGKPSAILYQPNGFTAGTGSLIDTLLTRAGFNNLAAEKGLQNYGAVPLEMIVALQPDALIMNAEHEAPTLAYDVLRHPVLKVLPRMKIVNIPPRLWTCAGPEMVEAVALLAAAGRRITGDER
ncbi:ABC transporter substrate-binding protein [Rhodoligotrophos ferricapiens]|uniref:ABC transporter substrate-binding protein n=1 Tax=Rhodoligotrophos ferricapiens TaxID=3069264 RepID=UPI00315C581A